MKTIEVQGPIKPGTVMAQVFMALFEPRTIDELCDRVWNEQSKYSARNARTVMATIKDRGYSIRRQRPKPRAPWTYELVNGGHGRIDY